MIAHFNDYYTQKLICMQQFLVEVMLACETAKNNPVKKSLCRLYMQKHKKQEKKACRKPVLKNERFEKRKSKKVIVQVSQKQYVNL